MSDELIPGRRFDGYGHVLNLAELVEGRVSRFAEQYGKQMLSGEPLPPSAANQFAEFAGNCRDLLHAVKALPDWLPPLETKPHE